MKWKPVYSGPGKSGVCGCGHKWTSHHLDMVANLDYIDLTREAYIVGECLKYGANEAGGLKYNKKTGNWDDHCFKFMDRGVKDGSKTRKSTNK